MVEERISFEKLVKGATFLTMRSWRTVKSAMLFCKSRMLRKKSLEVSAAGLIVFGGAIAGPW